MTIRDIAKIANVSPAAVSIVINNKPGVSDSTRKKILAIINDYGYKVNNPILKKEHTNYGNIRFIKYKKYGPIVEENGDFISQIIDGVNKEAVKFGYNVIMTTVDTHDSINLKNILKNGDHQGLIVLGTELNDSDIKLLEEIELPIVILDNFFEFQQYDCVVMNNVDGAYQAVKELVKLGYKDIGYFRSSITIHNFLARYEGYKKALKQFDIELKKENIFFLEPTLDGAYNSMKKILETGQKLPRAVFADNDTIAAGAIKALVEKGINIPKDLSIIGFDDISYSVMITPPLSTMKIYKEQLGRLAVGRLMDKINYDDQTIIKTQVQAEYIGRGSTCPYEQ